MKEYFLLFLQCFQKASLPGALKVVIVWYRVNFLPHDKILCLPKLKVLAEYKIYVTEKLLFVLEREENFAGKGENAGF